MSRYDQLAEQWWHWYADQIGRRYDEVTTPALLLDLDAARRNIERMAAKFRELPASLRPHVKGHKSPQLARLEVEAGAVGVACATVWEAEVMATAGIDDVLIANEVVHPDKVRELAALAAGHRITVAVDGLANVDQLERALDRQGAQLEVLIEIDVGMGRCGVRDVADAVGLAERIAGAGHLHLRGLQGFEGHCMLELDREVRCAMTQAANEKLAAAADLLAERGHPSHDISGGGMGTYFITGAHSRITEVQAGSYSLMDAFHEQLVPGEFEVALTVLGTVISHQGNTVILDAGRKAVGVDFAIPPLASVKGGTVRAYAEEHCVIDFDGPSPLTVGDRAEVLPGYGPTTVNLHDVFFVIEDRVVTDIWPVNPRGPGRGHWPIAPP